MRWVFIVLLMFNGIYYVWQQYVLTEDATQGLVAKHSGGQPSGRLVLLKELSEEGAAQEVPARGASKPSICWLIGPFKEEVTGRQVVNRLEALDIKLQLRDVTLSGKPDYWVHIPPLPSRKAALKLLRELQSRKIDSFLIAQGELKNGISLGLFTQKGRAESVYKKRAEQGYEAKINVIPRTYTERWAVFDVDKYGEFSDVLWDKVKAGNKGLERRKNYCDKIASTDNME